MELHNDYNKYLDEILSGQGISQPTKDSIKSLIVPERIEYERKNSNWGRFWFAFFVVILFSGSYVATFYAMYKVSEIEVILIFAGRLESINRSINGTTIATLLAATVTQTGLAFYAIAKYLFPDTLQK